MSWVLLLQLPPDDRQVHGPLDNLVVMPGLGGGEKGKPSRKTEKVEVQKKKEKMENEVGQE